MPLITEEQMRRAVAIRDKSQDGHFIYAVITTGVFCRPSCSTRAAKPENLRFFATVEGAMAAGFRPCKRCQPVGETQVDRLVEIARFIEQNAEQKLTLADLAKIIALSPSRLQRVFKASFGISPKAYQDAVRMRHFKHSLQQGEAVTDAIFSSGFGSISRVYGEATRNIGMSPKSYRTGGSGETLSYAYRDTSLGPMLMAATDKGVCFVQFSENKTVLIEALEQEFPKAIITPSASEIAPELDTWMDALDEHISQGAPRPELPLDIRGTAFQMKVWQFLLSVREGDIISYAELAKQINKPKAVRAAASACGKNRIGVLIPCHRVLRGDGSLGGYRWGLERKRALLDAERARRAG